MSLRWTAHVAFNSEKWKLLSSWENRQRHCCKAFIGLSIRANQWRHYRVGITRGGDWGCHPYFLLQKNWRPFFCSSLALLLTSLRCHPRPWRVSPRAFFYLTDLVYLLFFVNLPTIIFSFGCHPPGGCHPGRSAPHRLLVTPLVQIWLVSDYPFL